MTTVPRLLVKRWPAKSYKQIRCALCYRRFMPWQERWRGANYFRHPYMQVHKGCGLEEESRGVR